MPNRWGGMDALFIFNSSLETNLDSDLHQPGWRQHIEIKCKLECFQAGSHEPATSPAGSPAELEKQ
jgi:hypothetical protein